MLIRVNKKNILFAFFVIVSLFISVILTSFSSSNHNQWIMSLYWTAIVIVVVYYITSNYVLRQNDRVLICLSFLIRLFQIIIKYFQTDLANPVLSEDAVGFWKVANQYYEGNYSTTYTMFPHLLNWEFHIFGINIYCCILVNILLYILMACCFFKILDLMSVKANVRLIAGIVICFFPYSFVIVTSLLRESVYFFFSTFAFLLYIKYIYYKRDIYFLLSIASLLPILILHIGYFPIAIVFFLDSIRNQRINTKKNLIGRFMLLMMIAAFVLIASRLNSVSYLTGNSNNLPFFESVLNKLIGGTYDPSTLAAGSRYLPGIRIDSLKSLILYFPLKWFFYLASPLPMDWRGITDAAAFLCDSSIHLLVLFLGISVCLKYSKKNINDGKHLLMRRIFYVAFICFILCASVFCLGTANAGTALRHRDVLISYEIIVFIIWYSIRGKDGK